MSTQPSTPAQNPVALLQEQVLRLADIYQAQQEQINLLRLQNERLAKTLQALAERSSPQEKPSSVKVEDLRIPLGSMFVLLLKFVPALIMAQLLWTLIIFICLLALGVLRSPLPRLLLPR